jgi:hypothetical protein
MLMTEIYINIHSRLLSCSRDDIEVDIEELLCGRGSVTGAGSALDGSGSNIDIALDTDDPVAIDQFVHELIALLRQCAVPTETNLRVITSANDRKILVYEGSN